jgi:hypothetical protein
MPDPNQPSRRRLPAVFAVVLVPIVPIVIAFALSSGGSAHPAAVTTTATSAYTPVKATRHASTRHSPTAPRRSTTASRAAGWA